MKTKFMALAGCVFMAVSTMVSCGGTPLNKMEKYTVDFSVKDGESVQNLKKFDNFTSTWGWVGSEPGTTDPNTLKMVPALDDIKAESLRFDLFMGYNGLGYNIGRAGNNGTTDEEFSQSMQLINTLKTNNVLPYVVYFAAPEYVGSNWKKIDDLSKWEELCKNISTYFKNNGIRLGGHEIWNEPDFDGAFFAGDWVEYIDAYIAGSKGVRAGNPDAIVSAMSAAHIHNICNDKVTVKNDGVKTGFQRFIERTYETCLPDAISWHYYGRQGEIKNRPDEGENLSTYLNAIRSSLQGYQDGTHSDLQEGVKYPKLETMQQHLNEFNIYAPGLDAMYQTVEMLPGMFYALDTLLEATDITRVAWAALVGEKNGKLSYDLIDGQSFQRYPAYHALWMYAHLPVDRVNVDLGKNLGTMAGVDSHRAGMIVYNKTDKTQEASVELKNLPFKKGNLDVYLVDDEHYSYTTQNAPLLVRTRENIVTDGTEVRMKLKPNSAYYIEMNDIDGVTDIEDYNKVGNIVRKDYWYPERGDNSPYSDIHENSFTAHVGMANNEKGKSAVCVTVDGLKDVKGLNVSYETWGNIVKSEDASMGIRIDYRKSDGSYQAGKLYTVNGLNHNVITPFGSKGEAFEVVSMGEEKAGKYEISFLDAPADWDGRIQITYLVENAGKGATGKFIIREKN